MIAAPFALLDLATWIFVLDLDLFAPASARPPTRIGDQADAATSAGCGVASQYA